MEFMDKKMNMKSWLEQELDNVKASYTRQIRFMTGPYHSEIERMKEYNGRQILELLQNADDEAENHSNPRMLIRLEADRLIISNNGNPFSEKGVLSLMYPNNSPKRKRRKKIGYKGLGFRAILNWSHSIWIKSGPFSIEFSREIAISFLKGLLGKNPDLEKNMKETTSDPFPIATLAVPKWKEAEGLNRLNLPEKYDTNIVINFSSKKVAMDIQKQINELDMRVALFLNHLEEIRLESPEKKQTIQRIPNQRNEYKIRRLEYLMNRLILWNILKKKLRLKN